ncbi:MAG: hypothetical protein NVS4B11_01160 [Ktedonobacteraceae bacterium]
MKQGNGTDVLGLNDPRNASIGVIYVSPNDEKKSVLSAILTQEKLGRKQVAVVLPDQNKAFQRPGDFDDLKSLRGKLQTQIVFITAGGPGPAAFARQRNFLVYSTLEIFAKALKDEKQMQPENKKGWFFGTSKQKAVVPTDETAHTGVVEAASFIAPLSGEEVPVSHNDHVVPLVLGGAEVVATTATNGHNTIPKDRDVPSTTSSTQAHREDDWHALAPVAAASAVPISEPVLAKNGTNGNNGHHVESENDANGPGIIVLAPTRSKATVKLPAAKDAVVPLVVPVAKPQPAPPASRATKQRNSDKVAAVGAGVAGGMAAASLARTAGVGSAPPPRANASGGGGGGGGRPRRGGLLIALAVLLALTTAVFGGIALSASNLLGPLKNVIPKITAQTTVNIVPDTKTENNSYLISGVQSNPDASKREVSARVVSASSASQSKTVNATGVKQTPATAATGTITFYSAFPSSQRIAITSFTLNGAKFENDVSVVVPGETNPPTEGFVTVNAHAITLGSGGNLANKVFYGSCCATDITAYIGPFSGGKDPQNYTFVQQGDIQGAINALQPALVTQAQGALKPKINANEQIAGPTTCSPSIAQDHNAGEKAAAVTVTMTVTCSAEVYDQKGTLALVTSLLKAKATNDYGTDYALVGNVVTQAQVQGVNKGIVNLLVSAKGIWAYQFTTARQLELKKLIAGRSASDAVTILKGQKGVADASIDPSSGTLPTNLDDIKFVIQLVTGLSSGGTPGGVNTTPTITGPGTNPTTGPGLGISGS